MVVAPRIGARLYRDEFVVAVLVGNGAARAGEVRIERRRMLIDDMHIASAGIGLPEFYERIGDRPLVLIEHMPVHDDTLA
jgi:hypothetical protein